ncbi:hypothetical protein BKP35_00405 [Anaerobacillus arseniciselenatis]|uniref:DUF4367 domain-containing protein n=1 Tax=Anaerobacillus arseniciselenatis TaxID=85682 RepID=A0A1S2LSK4_9BACI|nr:hypothetical protein [Anaerobacillus arseniciselenatis]OIJ15491.1 hypothetical protein BKP35_00405 [Anaerobacillus arseniciselenatis]
MKPYNDQSEFDRTFQRLDTTKFNENEKKEVFSTIMHSLDHSKRKRRHTNIFNHVFSTVFVALFVLIGGYFLVTEVIFDGQPNQGAVYEERDELEQILSQELNSNVYVPWHEDFPAKTGIVKYSTVFQDNTPTKGEPISATVYYFVEQNDDNQLTKEETLHFEERNRSEVVFGSLYSESAMVTVDIFTGSAPSMEDAVEINIEGKEVLYSYIEREPNDTAWFALEFNDVWYVFLHKLEEVTTEDDAMNFVENFIQRLNTLVIN